METERSVPGHHRLSPAVLLAIFATATVLRFGYGAYRAAMAADPLSLTFPDEVDYWTIAQNLHDGHGLLDPMGFRAARMPLYPAFLSLFTTFERGVLYAKAVQHLIGALAAVLVAILTSRIASRRSAILAGLAVACDPFLSFFSSFLLTETVFITALVALWTLGIDFRFPTCPGRSRIVSKGSDFRLHSDLQPNERPHVHPRVAIRWCLVGALAATCVLIRESSLFLVLAWILVLALRGRPVAPGSDPAAREGIPAGPGARRDSRTSHEHSRTSHEHSRTSHEWDSRTSRGGRSEIGDRNPWTRYGCIQGRSEIGNWLGPTLAAVIIVAALIPWALRNRLALGEFVWLTTRGGVSLYDGVGPQATGRSDLADVYRRPELRGLSEIEWDRWCRRAAWEAVRTDPGRIAKLAARKVIRTWSPLPNADEYQSALIRLISAGWTIPTWTLAVIGLWALRHRPAICLSLLMPALYFTAVHAVFVGSVRYRLPAVALTAVLTGIGADVIWRRVRRGLKDDSPEAGSAPGD